MNEIWKPIIIDDIKTKYEISDYGRVRNSSSGKILSSYLSDGKLKTTLVINSSKRYDSTFSNEKLVLKEFYGISPKSGYIIFHKDGNVENVRLDNLEYITYEEYAYRMIDNFFIKDGDSYIIKDNNLHQDERWKYILNNGKITNYMVSNYGHIFNIIRSTYVSPSIGMHGYPSVTLSFDNKRYKIEMHRLVASYFVINDNPTIKTIVHHKNHNKADFIYTNLEWVTQSENAIEAVKFGAAKSGENAVNSTITEKQAHEICQMLESGYRISVIQESIGCSRSVIRHIKDRTSWKEVSKNYSFDNTYKYFKDQKDLDFAKYLLSIGKSRNDVKYITGFSLTLISKLVNKPDYIIFNIKPIIESGVLSLYNKGFNLDIISDITGLQKSYIKNILKYYEFQISN